MSPITENPGSRDQTDDAAQAGRHRDDYVALLAHELRNLLAPIRYAIAAMGKPGTTAAQQVQALDVMRRQSTQMSRLLEDLLDASRFARGELEIRKSATELTVVLGTAVEAARPLLDAKQHTLILELPKDAVRIWADPNRLVQVFSNLFINAAKYTDAGGHIQVRAIQDRESVVVTIRDSGVGISKEIIPRIFTLFVQEKGARIPSDGGLGIGLALVHGIVTLHKGTIEAHSEGPGYGSEFVVRLPIGTSEGDPPSVEEIDVTPAAGGLKVLVVDDNRDVADTCSMLIRLSGHRVQVAYNGRDAIIMAEEFRPQVVFTDIGLPDIDGFQVAQSIRATPWGKASVLVAVTGWGDAERREQSTAVGFNHHLTKPIDPATIDSLLASVAATFR